MTRRVWWALMVVALLAPAPVEAEIKLGIVDLQRALNESEAGQRAREQFKKEFEGVQESLRGEKVELDRLKEELEKKSRVLKESQLKSLAEDFERKGRDLRRKLEDSDVELRKRDNELTGTILRDLTEVIDEIGQRDGYTLILENSSQAVLYGAKGIDITDEVIRTFDAK